MVVLVCLLLLGNFFVLIWVCLFLFGGGFLFVCLCHKFLHRDPGSSVTSTSSARLKKMFYTSPTPGSGVA